MSAEIGKHQDHQSPCLIIDNIVLRQGCGIGKIAIRTDSQNIPEIIEWYEDLGILTHRDNIFYNQEGNLVHFHYTEDHYNTNPKEITDINQTKQTLDRIQRRLPDIKPEEKRAKKLVEKMLQRIA